MLIQSEEELRQIYFRTCNATGQFLLGIKNAEDLPKKHYCMKTFETGQPLEGRIQPIAFSDPFWWPAIATFVNAELSGSVKRIVDALPEAHSGQLDISIEV